MRRKSRRLSLSMRTDVVAATEGAGAAAAAEQPCPGSKVPRPLREVLCWDSLSERGCVRPDCSRQQRVRAPTHRA